MDSGLDYGLDYGLNFGLDWTVNNVLDLRIKKTLNAGLPNKWRIGLTVGTDMHAAFSVTI